MNTINAQLLTVQLIMILVLFLLIIKLLKVRKSMNYVRRVGSYGIDSISETDASFFDKLYKLFLIVDKSLSSMFKKSKLLVIDAKRFEKYTSYDNLKTIEGIDYISIKLLIALLFVSFNIITFMFQYAKVNYLLLFITFIIGYFIYDIYLRISYIRYRHQIEDDLLKAVIIMNNAFQSGRNIMQAIDTVIDQLDGPIQEEYKKINLDISYGLSIEDVFNRFYDRVQLVDAKYMASSLSLLDKTGGNVVKVFDVIEKSIISKKKLRDEVKTMTSASILMIKILVALPILLIGTILLLDNTYFNPLFNNLLGIITIIMTSLLYIFYILIIRKIMRVDI